MLIRRRSQVEDGGFYGANIVNLYSPLDAVRVLNVATGSAHSVMTMYQAATQARLTMII